MPLQTNCQARFPPGAWFEDAIHLPWLAAGLVVVATGCWFQGDGRQPRVRVTGSVVCDGKPVDGARVIFYPLAEGLPAAHGGTDAAGRFQLTTFDPQDGAAPGAYVAMVTKTEAEGELTYEEGEAYFQRTGKPPPFPEVKNLLPAKYGSHETSDLRCEVVADRTNEFPLQLFSK
jgi:hypothetical protein